MCPCCAGVCRRADKLIDLKPLGVRQFKWVASDRFWVGTERRSTAGNRCHWSSKGRSVNMPSIAEPECV